MTLPELEALAERTVFRDWEPHFKPYGIDFLFWWTKGKSKTVDRYVASTWGEERVWKTMRSVVLDEVEREAVLDFRVEPRGK